MSKALKKSIPSANLRVGILGVAAALILGLGPAGAHQVGPKLHLGDAPLYQ